MDIVFRAIGLVLIAVVLVLVLSKDQKDMAMLLCVVACCLVVIGAVSYLEPVVDFLRELQKLGQLDGGMLEILFKVIGIGLLTEIAVLICTDSGNASLGKALQILASAVIFWLSIPMLQSLLDLIQTILGEI